MGEPSTSDGSIDALPCTMGATRTYKRTDEVARAAYLDADRTCPRFPWLEHVARHGKRGHLRQCLVAVAWAIADARMR